MARPPISRSTSAPSKTTQPQTAAAKRKQNRPLTLAQLARIDDLATDLLVDRVYFWTAVRKNKAHYAAWAPRPARRCRTAASTAAPTPPHEPERGDAESDAAGALSDSALERGHSETIPRILRETVLATGNLSAAVSRITNLPTVNRIPSDRKNLEAHLSRYAAIYLPECAFEVGTTSRYGPPEAAVIARLPVRRGTAIKGLGGALVRLSTAEELRLAKTRRDFSIVVSARTGVSSVFLGPARFANHDCDPNAGLEVEGREIRVVARRDIAVGEEVTVTYGESYFGVDNADCLCATCEQKGMSGWADTLVALEDGSAQADTALANAVASLRDSTATPDPDNASGDDSAVPRKRRRIDKRAAEQPAFSRLAPFLRQCARLHQPVDRALKTALALGGIDSIVDAKAGMTESGFLTPGSSRADSVGVEGEKKRVPGDYFFGALAGDGRWAVCATSLCGDVFVQKPDEGESVNRDELRTGRLCPRCTRHKRLFGVEWPGR